MADAAAKPPGVVARDDLGRTIALERPARRIVGLAPSAVELLYAAGAGERIAGVCAEADYPPAARSLPRAGSFSNPDEEALAALRPDLVVMAHGNPRALIERLSARGIPVFVQHARRVADIPAALRALGDLAGTAPAARKAAAAFAARVSAVERRIHGRTRPRTALLIWDDPLTLAGSGAYLDDALRLAGGENIAGDLSAPYPTLDPESFAARSPQVILYATHAEARLRGVSARPGVRGTPAARTGRVYAVPVDPLLRPGPRLAEGVEALARAIHPESASPRVGRR